MRALVGITTIAAALFLSACTTPLAASTAATTTRHADRSLCGEVGQVTSLSVHRVSLNPERFSFPSDVRAHGSTARAVARALCSLPRSPSGVFFCASAWGPAYHVAFFDGSRVVSVDLVVPTGCASVLENWTSATQVALAPTGRFWKALGRAVGVTDATAEAFAGTLVDR